MTMLRASLLMLLLAAPALAQDCNICGDDNFIGFPQGVVTFEYQGEERTNNCKTWQNIVANPVAISDDFCRNEMIYYTAEVCRCYTPDEEMVIDILNAQAEEEENGTANNGGDDTSDSEGGSGGDSDGGEDGTGGNENGGGQEGGGEEEEGRGDESPVDDLGTVVDDDGDDSSATALFSSIAVAGSVLAILLA